MAARHPPSRAVKPREKDYKVTDRDGMYVHVTAKGAMSFRMDYRLNGRRETIYLGKYEPGGLSLARHGRSSSTQGATSLLDILIIPAGDDLARDVRFGASTLID